jgi:hypothetical protein
LNRYIVTSSAVAGINDPALSYDNEAPGGFLLPALVSPGAKPCLALPQIETSGSEKDEKLSDGFFCFRGCLYFEEAFFGGDAGSVWENRN